MDETRKSTKVTFEIKTYILHGNKIYCSPEYTITTFITPTFTFSSTIRRISKEFSGDVFFLLKTLPQTTLSYNLFVKEERGLVIITASLRVVST